jgi:DNA-binding transcriptional regulator YiaG
LQPPTPAEIRAARKAVGLTQTQAGEMVYVALRTWQHWEFGDSQMHPAIWELFRLKAGQLK